MDYKFGVTSSEAKLGVKEVKSTLLRCPSLPKTSHSNCTEFTELQSQRALFPQKAESSWVLGSLWLLTSWLQRYLKGLWENR